MSRIGKSPVQIPDKVEVTLKETSNGTEVTVKGPKGTLSRTFRPEIIISQEGNILTVSRKDESRLARSLHGLSRTLLNNMVLGVSQGFTRNLEIVGVGYRAQVQGNKLVLALGYSHPVEIEAPANISFAVEANTKLQVSGLDKEVVGQIAALIRSKRPPEPYKGKGVKYAGERIRRKAGKAGKK
ncbi:MAG: ribosomal protein [Vampirovibrio sp.]|jgi:large subunit ribosomal protein L6|nr:ribosomal protein [Vampirovibrio sp.]